MAGLFNRAKTWWHQDRDAGGAAACGAAAEGKEEGVFLPDTIQDLPDDQLVEVARNDLQGSGPIVEAMRRLRVAIEKSNVESGIYSRRMFWLSIILGFLTLVQAIAAVPTITAWFARH